MLYNIVKLQTSSKKIRKNRNCCNRSSLVYTKWRFLRRFSWSTTARQFDIKSFQDWADLLFIMQVHKTPCWNIQEKKIYLKTTKKETNLACNLSKTEDELLLLNKDRCPNLGRASKNWNVDKCSMARRHSWSLLQMQQVANPLRQYVTYLNGGDWTRLSTSLTFHRVDMESRTPWLDLYISSTFGFLSTLTWAKVSFNASLFV